MGGGKPHLQRNIYMSEMVTQRRKKILIADDSEMNRDLLAAILEDEYDIVQANDGVICRSTQKSFLWCFWILLCLRWTALKYLHI